MTTAPDLSRCGPGCANVARSDTHIRRLQDEQAWHQQQANAVTTPEPLRQRHQQRAAMLEQVAAEHIATRRPAQPHCGTARPEHRSDDTHPDTTTNTEGLL